MQQTEFKVESPFWPTILLNSIMPQYRQDRYLPFKFLAVFWEGIKMTPSLKDHKPDTRTWSGKVEYLGDILLIPKDKLPHIIHNLATNPQAIAAIAFIVLNISWSFLLYPTQTKNILKLMKDILPTLTKEKIRLAVWVIGVNVITGLSARFGGRLTDTYLKALDIQNQKEYKQS